MVNSTKGNSPEEDTMSIAILTARAVLANYYESGNLPADFADFEPAFRACKREWQDSDDADETIDFWADIVCAWADAQSDMRPVRILTDAFGTAGPDVCDSLPYLYRLVSTLAADNGGRWFEDDGLREGRDYEYIEGD